MSDFFEPKPFLVFFDYLGNKNIYTWSDEEEAYTRHPDCDNGFTYGDAISNPSVFSLFDTVEEAQSV